MSINNVVLEGRLTRDPEMFGNNDMPVAKFSMAINRPFKNKQTGEYEADFPNVVAFGKTAEFIKNNFQKGKWISIVGRIQTGKYQHNDGHTVYTTEVVADRVSFVGDKLTYEQEERLAIQEADSDPVTMTDLPFDL